MTVLDAFADGFARRALLEAVMVGGLCGAVGVHVLLRRLPFFTMALGHATFPGVVLAALVGISLFAGAAAFGAVVVVVVALLGARDRVDDTSAVGVTLSGAFALGVLLLIEATVVSSIPAVGTILAVALIVAPAATARLWTERLRATMALAAALGATSGVVGLAISLQWRVAAGATIVLVAAALFAVSLLVAPNHGLLAAGRRRARTLEQPTGS